MAIVCKKCKYVMNKMQIVGYIFSDAYDIAKTVIPFLAPIIIRNHYGLNPKDFLGNKNIDPNNFINNNELSKQETKKYCIENDIESSIVMFFNQQKVICPFCSKYKGWIDIKENIIIKQGKTE